MSRSIPLSVLDLVPVVEGSQPSEALANTLHLARAAEHAGYHRYWVAEHHLNPGVAGSSPGVVITAVAGATTRIRVGSGVLLMGHQTSLSVVEQFGTIEALHPGRIDLGLGRSSGRRLPGTSAVPPEGQADKRRTQTSTATRDGLVIPKAFVPTGIFSSPRFAAQAKLLQHPQAVAPPYDEQVGQILALLGGRHHMEVTVPGADGERVAVDVAIQSVPGPGADIEVWVAGSSGGESAEIAGRLGLPFAANYHVSPASVLDAVESYRSSFRRSSRLERPYLMVSADVVAADTEEAARRHASGYALWVRSIRRGVGAIPYPTPSTSAAHEWTDEDRELVADRLDTQFVGTPSTVVDKLRVLAAETGADELLLTTIAHDHAARVRSYELIAEAWSAESSVAGTRSLSRPSLAGSRQRASARTSATSR